MCTIQVSNVPAEAKESELRVFFRFHGDIKAVQYDSGDRCVPRTPQPDGCGYAGVQC